MKHPACPTRWFYFKPFAQLICLPGPDHGGSAAAGSQHHAPYSVNSNAPRSYSHLPMPGRSGCRCSQPPLHVVALNQAVEGAEPVHHGFQPSRHAIPHCPRSKRPVGCWAVVFIPLALIVPLQALRPLFQRGFRRVPVEQPSFYNLGSRAAGNQFLCRFAQSAAAGSGKQDNGLSSKIIAFQK